MTKHFEEKKTKHFKVRGWSHIIIEGFCCINQDYEHKHSKWVYGWKGNKNPEDRGKKPNPDYDPDAKPDEKPDYCKGHVCDACIQENRTLCPHLAYCGVEKKLRKKFVKIVRKIYDVK